MDEFINHITAGNSFFLQSHISIVIICWISICLCVALDLASGVYAAKKAGEKLMSHNFRRSILKVATYGSFLILCMIFDIFGLILDFAQDGEFSWYHAPYCSMIATISVLLIEGKSMYENYKKAKAGVSSAMSLTTVIGEYVAKGLLKSGGVDRLKDEIVAQLNQKDNGKDDTE